ncbi:unnamed protein product [Chondrus crispus]|uniref:Ubiquitin carboxyl-terminal hydrolase n=1 Tax=Chondrus crispus TaxID=2769 RepID=R7QHX7_CHOCR|nr:unnamed protein product [Chondrus crispus]CDF37373.1 unnamed protein product [Chondrus crispus]|eukprot:XP_005717192.1 unnamed protein product [Chondrus crispus]
MSAQQWIPLESNPEVLTGFGHALGVSPDLVFSDVWSLELLDMVPAPCHAVLLLFPLTPKLRNAEVADSTSLTDSPDAPYFVRQTIGNACGTIALIHAALNAGRLAPAPSPDSFLSRFGEATKDMTPDDRAKALMEDASLDAVHGQFAAQGQTAAPSPTEKVDLHFVAFVHKAGKLWLLDGRRDKPFECGPCEEGNVLRSSAKIVMDRFMKADPTEQRFTILALTAKP